MDRKKIFGFGAVVLLVMLIFSPTLTPKTEEGINDISDLLAIYKEITAYFENNSTALLPGEEGFNDLYFGYSWAFNRSMNEKWINDSFGSKVIYEGITGYFTSNGSAPFLSEEGDDDLYFGHCWAFNRTVTVLICNIIEACIGISLIVSLLIALIPILGFFYGIFFVLVLLPSVSIIKERLDEIKNHTTGMICFYFDNVEEHGRVHDEFRFHLQKLEPCGPECYYNQTDWMQVTSPVQ